MNKIILELVEKLRLAGHINVPPASPDDVSGQQVVASLQGITALHNNPVDEAAKQLIAELEKQNSPTEQEKVTALLKAIQPVVDSFYSDAEGEKEWATFQDGIIHLGEVVEGLEEIERLKS